MDDDEVTWGSSSFFSPADLEDPFLSSRSIDKSMSERERKKREKSFTHFRRDQKNGKHLCRIEPEQIELTLMNERRERRDERFSFIG